MVREDLWKRVEAKIDEAAPQAFEVSDWMAAHPEIGGEERGATKKHAEFLSRFGFDVELPAWDIETAYRGVMAGCGAGRRAALMVEYDALPGLGHGCGHNAHGSMSLLAGAGLSAVMKEIPGELLMLGTPAEENLGGKIVMARRGAFDNLDFAIMIHCAGGQSCVGYRALACRAYEFTFEGKASHAASAPWEGRNALNAARILFESLDMWRQHLRPETRIHGIVTEGGYYANIVPERVVVQFYFRAPDNAMEDDLIEKALDCARGAALCTGTKVSWRLFEEPFDAMKPNPAAEAMVLKVFEELGVPALASHPALNSSDVGNVSWKCPALQPEFDISDGVFIAGHTREFLAASISPATHPKIVTGAKILAKSVLSVLTDDALAAEIRADFEKN